MNRLVIVGNGFDLAHGLPTGYCDFIDWYWSLVINNLQDFNNDFFEDDLIEVKLKFKRASKNSAVIDFKNVLKFIDLQNFVGKYTESYNSRYPERDYNRCFLKFKNSFFQAICDKRSIQNWIDIENEYFKILKKCLNDEDNVNVQILNDEFEEVKRLLEDYLLKNVNDKFDFNLPNGEYQQLLNIFLIKPFRLKDSPNHEYFKEFLTQDHQDLIEFDNILVKSDNDAKMQGDVDNGRIIQNNLILNFNYTPVFEKYISMMDKRTGYNRHVAFGNTWQIQIHGKLKSLDNTINFGFGDEMDDDYKKIENKDDNEYLRNIKSFQYLQNSNYKYMLDFIESDKFQVYIMGHSCGLSDRILLNKIFENHNCRSIKVFYYKKGDWDNYTEIVQNISRHFNKKEMMREKIVNKSLCQPLPQNIRFDKKENGLQS